MALDRGLRRLARLHGVQPSYYDIAGRLREAEPDALLDVLRALDAPVAGPGDVADAIRQRALQLRRRALPPVIVAWDGVPPTVKLHRPAGADAAPWLVLEREDGERVQWRAAVEPLGTRVVAGAAFRVDRVRLPTPLPHGYHRLHVEAARGAVEARAHVISAPVRAWSPGDVAGSGRPLAGPAGPSDGPDRGAGGGRGPEWGVFLPLYALRTTRSTGVGDLTDLAALARWAGGRGASLLGTLPLLATFLGRAPYEPSPYAPASRLFWNELFLDVGRAPELAQAQAARATLDAERQRSAAVWREAETVDYRAEAVWKRAVLDRLAERFFESGGAESAGFQEFLRLAPEAPRYAGFRAAVEQRGASWPAWPAPDRGRPLAEGDYREPDRRTHLYAQYLLHGQLEAAAAAARSAGAPLYLDLPLGVHPDGYDTWAHQELFARSVSAGAPPDPFISRGQSWGFPPLKPEALRLQGYRYLVDCLRTHLRYAGALRLDHVMGLHRLFWVPDGREPVDGVYVRNRPEELYAVLALESRRAGARIIGEDLGTVPATVRQAMRRHGVRRMYVAQFTLSTDPARAIEPPPRDAVAALNTHDMPPFAAFWRGADIEDRRALGWLDDAGAESERRWRQAQREAVVAFLRGTGELAPDHDDTAHVLRALLHHLARSNAEVLLVNLEDLWLEARPQNVPGTWRERPNWRGRAAHRLEAFDALESVRMGIGAVEGGRRECEAGM